MGANGAHGGRFLRRFHMAAAAAKPVPAKDLALFQVIQQLEIPFLMGLFDPGDARKLSGQVQGSLLLGGPGHPGVPLRPLVVFSGGGRRRLFRCGTGTLLGPEPQLGVFLLMQRGGLKDGRDRFAAHLGLAGEMIALAAGLRLPGKRDPQFGLRLAFLSFRAAALPSQDG